MQTATQITGNFATLRVQNEWSFKEARRKEISAFSHSYHRYPAKFIPQIVSKLVMQNTLPGEVICDPFGGCGTTLVESKLLGRISYGFDINPIAKLITQTKITPISPSLIKKYRENLLTNYEIAPLINHERNSKLHYWFADEIIDELDRIYYSINRIKNDDIRRFFLCGFSHILKNCSRWLMKSIKPTLDKNKIPPQPKDIFLRHIDSMIKKNDIFYEELKRTGNLKTTSKMYRCDSTKEWPMKTESVDLIITSPPYVTSYEYADLHQLSLLWFGDDKNAFKQWNKFSEEFTEFKRKFIGTSNKKNNKGDFNSVTADTIVQSLMTVNKSLAANVTNYFLDMKKVFKEMYRVLKNGKKACIIIGNTNISGVDILNAEVTAEQMQAIGFSEVEFIKREVPNKMITPWRDTKTGKFTSRSNPQKKRAYEFEYILVLSKN